MRLNEVGWDRTKCTESTLGIYCKLVCDGLVVSVYFDSAIIPNQQHTYTHPINPYCLKTIDASLCDPVVKLSPTQGIALSPYVTRIRATSSPPMPTVSLHRSQMTRISSDTQGFAVQYQ